MTTETRSTGEGTVDVNVDRGIVLHNEMRMTTDTSMRSQGSPMIPSMQSHGTTTLSVDVIKSGAIRERCGSGGYVRLPACGVGRFLSHRTRDKEVMPSLSKRRATPSTGIGVVLFSRHEENYT